MFRLRMLALAGLRWASVRCLVQAQDADLKAVLRRSIDAHGGAANFAKFKAVSSHFKGTMELLAKTRDISGESTLQKPDKFKNVMTLDLEGNQVKVVTVYNGQKMWVSAAGQVKEIDDPKVLNELRESLKIEGAGSLSEFLDKPYELSAIGEVKVKDKDAIGIRISKKDQRDFNLYFDKKTHLIVKTEMRALDATTMQEVTQEKFIIGYQEKNGVKVARRVVIHNDGKPFMDVEILDVQVLEKLDDATFAMP